MGARAPWATLPAADSASSADDLNGNSFTVGET
jgi:hypothetical protein